MNTEVQDGGGLEPGKLALDPASSRSKPCAFLKNILKILSGRRSSLALLGKKQTVIRDQLSDQKPPGSRLWFSRTRVQHSPGSSTIKLSSALSLNLVGVLIHPIEDATERLRVPNRLSATTVPSASRVEFCSSTAAVQWVDLDTRHVDNIQQNSALSAESEIGTRFVRACIVY